jgi:2-polyprenyl-3-methyl-5-hydroxy-6-metoxy-1,4-benzoquinol methylase
MTLPEQDERPVPAGQAESTRAWDANAAYWDERMGEGNRWHLELVWPSTLRMVGDVGGRTVLDVGCGNGLACRRLASLGASVVGIDASAAMLAHARDRSGDAAIEYAQVDATDEAALAALGESRFDAAIACMVLMDMAEVAPLYRALARILRPGAPFIFAVPHPAFNQGDAYEVTERRYTEHGREEITHMKVTAYLDEVTQWSVAMSGQPEPQPYFHRPISALLRPAFEAGLVLDALEEPAFAEAQPEGFRRPPAFPPVLVCRLRRPN